MKKNNIISKINFIDKIFHNIGKNSLLKYLKLFERCYAIGKLMLF